MKPRNQRGSNKQNGAVTTHLIVISSMEKQRFASSGENPNPGAFETNICTYHSNMVRNSPTGSAIVALLWYHGFNLGSQYISQMFPIRGMHITAGRKGEKSRQSRRGSGSCSGFDWLQATYHFTHLKNGWRSNLSNVAMLHTRKAPSNSIERKTHAPPQLGLCYTSH